VVIRREPLLQQATRYLGGETERLGDVARTFFAYNGTIGLAYEKKRIVATRLLRAGENDAEFAADLKQDMNALELDEHSQEMSRAVRSLLAIPLLSRERVVAVLYADSVQAGIFTDQAIRPLVEMCRSFCSGLQSLAKIVPSYEQDWEVDVYQRKRVELRILNLVNIDPPSTPLESDLNFVFSAFQTRQGK
jgi:hypothetical protein